MAQGFLIPRAKTEAGVLGDRLEMK
jgi:hypothetical protein